MTVHQAGKADIDRVTDTITLAFGADPVWGPALEPPDGRTDRLPSRLDSLGVASYLESTNPANDHRYERAGFQRIGGFSAVRDDAPISTMWRRIGGS